MKAERKNSIQCFISSKMIDINTTGYQKRGFLRTIHGINVIPGIVGIATAYGLDGPGIEYRWGEIFRTCTDRP